MIRIFCATANPMEVLVAETEQGRAILGVVDGGSPLGVETERDVAERMALLRRFGYKLLSRLTSGLFDRSAAPRAALYEDGPAVKVG